MDWKNIIVWVSLIIAVGSSYTALVLGYIKYRRLLKEKESSKKYNRIFFIFLIVGIAFFVVWGFARNLTMPFL